MSAKTTRLGLTTSEAARHLGVSLSTIRRWSDLGYLRGYRTPGGQRRFSMAQLDDFMASLEAGGPVPQAPAAAEPEPPAPVAFRRPAAGLRLERPGPPASAEPAGAGETSAEPAVSGESPGPSAPQGDPGDDPAAA